MNANDPIRLEAQLEIAGDHLSGEVIRAGRCPIPFSGWMGLLGAVERACDLTSENDTNEEPRQRQEI